MATLTDPKPVLSALTLYLAHDRFVCGTTGCAGYTAVYTGYTTGGAPVEYVTPADVDAWDELDLGPMQCECGRVTARVVHGRVHHTTNV